MADLDVKVRMEDAGGSIEKVKRSLNGVKSEASTADSSVTKMGKNAKAAGDGTAVSMKGAMSATKALAGVFGVTVGVAAALRLGITAIKSEYEALAKGINDTISAQLAFNALQAQERGGYVPAGTVALTEQLSQEYEKRGLSIQAEDLAAAFAIALPQAQEIGIDSKELTSILTEMLARSGNIEKGTLAEQAQALSMVLRSGSIRSIKGLSVSEEFAQEIMDETNTTRKAAVVAQEMQRQFNENSVLDEMLTTKDTSVRAAVARRGAAVEQERLGQREGLAVMGDELEYQQYLEDMRKKGIDPERASAMFLHFQEWITARSKKPGPYKSWTEATEQPNLQKSLEAVQNYGQRSVDAIARYYEEAGRKLEPVPIVLVPAEPRQ